MDQLTNGWTKPLMKLWVRNYNSRKSVTWSAVPIAPKFVYIWSGGERGSGPEGANDLCWARIWALRLGYKTPGWNLSFEAKILALRLGFEPRDWDWKHEVRIWACRLGSKPWGLGLILEASIQTLRLKLEPEVLDWSHGAGIGALRLGLEPWGRDLGLKAKFWRGGEGRVAKWVAGGQGEVVTGKSFYSRTCNYTSCPVGPSVRLSTYQSICPSACPSLTFFNCKWCLHNCPCPTTHHCLAIYPTLFSTEINFYDSIAIPRQLQDNSGYLKDNSRTTQR